MEVKNLSSKGNHVEGGTKVVFNDIIIIEKITSYSGIILICLLKIIQKQSII